MSGEGGRIIPGALMQPGVLDPEHFCPCGCEKTSEADPPAEI